MLEKLEHHFARYEPDKMVQSYLYQYWHNCDFEGKPIWNTNKSQDRHARQQNPGNRKRNKRKNHDQPRGGRQSRRGRFDNEPNERQRPSHGRKDSRRPRDSKRKPQCPNPIYKKAGTAWNHAPVDWRYGQKSSRGPKQGNLGKARQKQPTSSGSKACYRLVMP